MGRLFDLSPRSPAATSRTTIALEIEAANEPLLRDYAAFLDETRRLAAAAPEGAVLDVCEGTVIERGREHRRRALERAVRVRLDAAEKS